MHAGHHEGAAGAAAAARGLLGTGCVLTGLSSDAARTLAASGSDMGGVRALRTLYEALQLAVQGTAKI